MPGPSLIVRVRLTPTALQSHTFEQWWHDVLDLEPFAAQLARSWLMRRPIRDSQELIKCTRASGPYDVLDPNQPFVGHRTLYRNAGMPDKHTFQTVLNGVRRQVVQPNGLACDLVGGLAYRFFDAIAHGDSSTVGDLPAVRTPWATPEVMLSGIRALDDDAVLFPGADGPPLAVRAELFTLDPYVLDALQRGSFPGVIQAAGGDWWLWIVVRLPEPIILPVPTAQAVGIDPGMRHNLTAYSDQGRLTLPKLLPAPSLRPRDRRQAYEEQADHIREITRTLLQHEWIGVEGTGRGERVDDQLVNHLRHSFVTTVLDRLAGLAHATRTRHVLQVPGQYSSQICPVSQGWLDFQTYRSTRRECGDGQVWDRDDIASHNLRARAVAFGERCPRWWRHIPVEIRHCAGDYAELLYKRPLKPRDQWADAQEQRRKQREQRAEARRREEGARPRPGWLAEE